MVVDRQRMRNAIRDPSTCIGCTERFTACSDQCPKEARGEYGYDSWIAERKLNVSRTTEENISEGKTLERRPTTRVWIMSKTIFAIIGAVVAVLGAAAAILGARAAYIGGCIGTACAVSDEIYGVPALGTMAHSWVQMFDSEYEAFVAYCKCYPNSATLLVDTYNSLKSGVPNAIRVFNEILKPKGITKCAIRIDSGDITYLTKKIRAELIRQGLPECKIIVSNSLDEYIIRELIRQGAEVDAFGVGERLITAESAAGDNVVKHVAVSAFPIGMTGRLASESCFNHSNV